MACGIRGIGRSGVHDRSRGLPSPAPPCHCRTDGHVPPFGVANCNRCLRRNRLLNWWTMKLTPLPSTLLAVLMLPCLALAQPLTVDAMVGQVNGRPIYASRVFELIDRELSALGRQVPPEQFNLEARRIISGRISSIIIEALILGEAERDLNQQEQYGLQYMVKQRREELVRALGRGSEAVANAAMKEAQGTTLDEQLEEYRQGLLVKRHLQKKVLPQINISRKDIERYYARHFDTYNAPPGRVIHMIRTNKSASAERIDQRLSDHEPFLDVAADAELNQNKPDQQGLFGEFPGDQIFGLATLNDATLKLAAGEHTPRITENGVHYWIFVRSLSDGRARPLREVQGEIEQILRRQRYNELTNRYHQHLFETGSYDSLDQMVEALVQVAMSRYAMASR